MSATHIGLPAGRVLGVAVGGEYADRSVKVDVDGDTARLSARLSISYPASVARTTAALAGTRGNPALVAVVSVEQEADPAEIRDASGPWLEVVTGDTAE
ncbi:hypothetical protein [Amycolatopsis sp. Hca4]|uniref:hypothetical protein n=1 Tax=Amycolatopsis sp. Hca4 TaxID=2742131 RepID=UPI001590985F|nr:hypothetical protein [Amycolatopsis sp. Hca4]QKV73913.1 hypothetical protein HUT10_09125 [Amycolatopsis sp. Hca4]